MGVGEIILTSINNEGTGKGFDLTLYEKASAICKISLLAHGGTRNSKDVYKLFIIYFVFLFMYFLTQPS